MDKHNENNKFGSIFSNINAVLNNRKKESSKTYLKKPTLKSILLTISLVVVVAIFYFQYLSVFHVDVTNMNNTQVYINIWLMFVFLSVGFLLSIILYKIKCVRFFVLSTIPTIIVGLILLQITKDFYVLYGLSLAIFSLGCGFSVGLTVSIFFYTYDMSERLIFSLMLVFIFFSYSFYYNAKFTPIIKDLIIPCVLLAFSYICMILNYEMFDSPRNSEIIPTYSIVMLFGMMILVCLSNGVTGAIQEIVHYNIKSFRSYYSITNYIGFILSVGAVILVFLFAKKSIVLLTTVYFIGLFDAYIFTMFNYMYNPELIYNFDFKFFRQVADVAFGFTSSLGNILLLMLAGKVLDDKANTKTVLFVIFSFVCYFLSGIFFKKYLVNIDIRVICISMILLAGLASLLFSIFTSIGLFDSRSTKDTLVGETNRNQIKYNKINIDEVLTPKEKVIMDLLLEEMTLRQIAGELGMKYDAVNFHYKNIYRKLEVNSKIELILQYGSEK